VQVAAVDDTLVEGDHSVLIRHTSTSLSPIAAAIDSVTVTIKDNDEGNAAIVATTPNTDSGAVILVSEGGSVEIEVHLAAAADQTVTVTAEVEVPSAENIPGLGAVAVQPILVSFSSADYAIPQRLVLSTELNGVASGDVPVKLHLTASSLTGAYSGVATSLDLIMVDADIADVLVSPLGVTMVVEGGAEQEVEVTLSARPVEQVSLAWSDPSGRLVISPALATITPGGSPGNSLSAVFQISAARDGIAQGDTSLALYLTLYTSDPQFAEQDAPVLQVTVVDGDTAALRLEMPRTVTEGEMVEMQMSLATQPMAEEVVIGIGLEGVEGTLGMVMFTEADWSGESSGWSSLRFQVPHDGVVTGDRELAISTFVTSEDAVYAALSDAQAVTVTVQDIDSPAVCFRACSASSGALGYAATEGGDAVEVTVALASAPTSDVELRISIEDASQLTVRQAPPIISASLSAVSPYLSRFLLEAVDDQVQEGDQTVEVCVATSSGDPFYDGLSTCTQVAIEDSTLVNVVQVVGPDGATVTTFRGFNLTFPRDALPADTVIRVQQLRGSDLEATDCALDPTRYSLLAAYLLRAQGVADFGGRNVTLSWPAPSGEQRLNTLQCVTVSDACDEGGWTVVPGLVASSSSVLELGVSHFSRWALVQVKSVTSLAQGATSGGAVFVEDEPSVAVDDSVVLQVEEGFEALAYRGVIVAIASATHDPASDELLMEATPGFNATWDASTGELAIVAVPVGVTVTAESLTRALQAVRYLSRADWPAVDVPREIWLAIEDEHSVSDMMRWASVTLVNVPDPPVVVSTVAPARCVERGGTVALDQGLSISDVDSAQVRSARVWLEPLSAGDLLLAPPNEGGLDASVDPSGVWTVSGLADVASYQAFLRRFTLRNDGPRVDVSGSFTRTVWFRVEDGSGMRGSASRRIEMVPVNDPPVITDRSATFTVQEEATYVGHVAASDPEGEVVELSIACLPSIGVVEMWANGTFMYTGLRDKYGADVFLVQAEDASGARDFATVAVKVRNVPDPPVAVASRVEGVWLGEEATFDVGASDPDGSAVWVYITRDPAKGVLRLSEETPTQPGSSRRKGFNPVTYIAPVDGVAVMEEVTVEFVAVDEASTPLQMSQPAVVTLVLQNAAAVDNAPPEVLPVTVRTTEGHSVQAVFLAADDTSLPSQLTYEVLVLPELGVVEVTGDVGDSTFRYTPRRGVHGNDSFLYAAMDHFHATSRPAKVSILVEERNDPPLPACESDLFGEVSPLRDLLLSPTSSSSLWENGTLADPTAFESSELTRIASQPLLSEMFANETASAIGGREVMALSALSLVLTANTMPPSLAWVCSTETSVISGMTTNTSSPAAVELALFAYDADERRGLNNTILDQDGIQGTSQSMGTLSANNATTSASLVVSIVRYMPRPLLWGAPLDTLRWQVIDSEGLPSKAFAVHVHVECAPGYVKEATEAASGRCSPCPPGSFNLPGVTAQQQCIPCPLGTYMAEPASVTCTPCPASTYQDAEGQAECRQCPDAAMRSEVGSRNLRDCRCGLGTHVARKKKPKKHRGPPPAVPGCVPCPPGTLCNELNQALPKPKGAGMWVDPDSGAILECKPREACLVHRTVEEVVNGACAEGYTGPGCLRCERGMYRSNDGWCHRCSRFTWVLYVVAVLALLALIPVMVRLSAVQAFGSINILVSAMQANSILMQLDITWPRIVKRFFSLFAVFAIKFDVMSPECVAQDWHYLNKLIAVDMLPLFALPLMALYVYFGIQLRVIPVSPRVRSISHVVVDSLASYSAPLFLLLSWGYYTLMDVNVEYFNCFPNKGRYFMAVEPSIECWAYGDGAWNRHGSLLLLAGPALLLYGAGIPLLFASTLLRHRRLLLNRPALQSIWLYDVAPHQMSEEQWRAVEECGEDGPERLAALDRRCGFLFRRYTPSAFWWEVVVLARKLGLVLLQQISSPLEQTWALVILLLAYTCAVMRTQPYTSPLLVRMDICAMVITIMVTLLGFIFYSDTMPGVSSTVSGVVVFVMLVGNAIVLGVFVALDSYPGVLKFGRLYRLQRSQFAMETWRERWEGDDSQHGSGSERRFLRIGRYVRGFLGLDFGGTMARREVRRRDALLHTNPAAAGGDGDDANFGEGGAEQGTSAGAMRKVTATVVTFDMTEHDSGHMPANCDGDTIYDDAGAHMSRMTEGDRKSHNDRTGAILNIPGMSIEAEEGGGGGTVDRGSGGSAVEVIAAEYGAAHPESDDFSEINALSATASAEVRRARHLANQLNSSSASGPGDGWRVRGAWTEVSENREQLCRNSVSALKRGIGDTDARQCATRRRARDEMELRAPAEAHESWEALQRKSIPLVHVSDERKEALRRLRAILTPELYPRARDLIIGCKDAAQGKEFCECVRLLFCHIETEAEPPEPRKLLAEAEEMVGDMFAALRRFVGSFVREMFEVENIPESYAPREERHIANYREACALMPVGKDGKRPLPSVHGLLVERVMMRAQEWLAFEAGNGDRPLLGSLVELFREDREANDIEPYLHNSNSSDDEDDVRETIITEDDTLTGRDKDSLPRQSPSSMTGEGECAFSPVDRVAHYGVPIGRRESL
jgi:hypothetical protein